MKPSNSTNLSGFEDKVFLLLLAAISLAFAVVVWPFFGAVLWGVVLAVVFMPLSRWLSKLLGQRRSLGALATLVIIVVMVLLPLALIITALVKEAFGVYTRLQSEGLNLGQYFQRFTESLPAWASRLLEHFELKDLPALQQRLTVLLTKWGQFLFARAINFGQHTFAFVISVLIMLYLLFFLLRDGDRLAERIEKAIPLRAEQKRALFNKFIVVIRATVKGNLVIALLQGGLGGLIFWVLGIPAALLWGVVMAVLSLLPAVGAGLVWVPVAIYLLAAGSVGRGIVLLAYGTLVISMSDYLMRPKLVGKDTKMPDYVVLISTLGGIAAFGINGFVIGPIIAAMFMAAWDIFSAPE